MNEGLLLDAVRLSLQQPTSVFFQRLIMPDQFPIPTPAQEVHSPLQALRQLQPEHLLPRVRLTVGRELPGPSFTAWTACPGTAATITETITTPGIYRYRRTASFGCGTPVSTTADVTVYSTTHNAGVISGAPVCEGGTVNILNTTAASTGTPASSGPVYSWHRSVSPFSSWTALSGSGATYSETMNTAGTYRYRRTATFGCGSPVNATVDVVVNPLPEPDISGADNVCQNEEEIYTTPYLAGHTYPLVNKSWHHSQYKRQLGDHQME